MALITRKRKPITAHQIRYINWIKEVTINPLYSALAPIFYPYPGLRIYIDGDELIVTTKMKQNNEIITADCDIYDLADPTFLDQIKRDYPLARLPSKDTPEQSETVPCVAEHCSDVFK